MKIRVKPDGTPFVLFEAVVAAWRSNGARADRTWSKGFVIAEPSSEPNVLDISLWIRESWAGINGATLIARSVSTPRFTNARSAEEPLAASVEAFENQLQQELGSEWTASLNLVAL